MESSPIIYSLVLFLLLVAALWFLWLEAKVTQIIVGGLPVFGKLVFALLLGSGVIYLSNKIPNTEESSLLIAGLLGAVILSTIFFAIHVMRSNTAKTEATEAFTLQTSTNPDEMNLNILSMVSYCITTLETLQKESQMVQQLGQEACQVLKDAEVTYENVAMGDSRSESEQYYMCISKSSASVENPEEFCKGLKMPEAVKKQKEAFAKQFAGQLYKNEVAFFKILSGNKDTLIECFESMDTQERQDLEAELRPVAIELNEFLGSNVPSTMRALLRKITFSMQFVMYLVRKGQALVDGTPNFEPVKPIPQKRAKPHVSFPLQTMSGLPLLQAVATLLTEAEDLLKDITDGKAVYEAAMEKYQELTGNVNRMASGDVTDSDLAAVTEPKPTQGECPMFMYEYSNTKGGFCCPNAPINYNSEESEFTQCPTSKQISRKEQLKEIAKQSEACKKQGKGMECVKPFIAAQKSAFDKHPTGCRLEFNPDTESPLPVCTYVCKSGAECSYDDFIQENPPRKIPVSKSA